MTLHPTIVYYRDSNNQLAKESHIFLTDDIIHDYHAVNTFLQMSLNFKELDMTRISRIVVFSDSCSAQYNYKSKGPMADLSLSPIPMDHSFFGSEHGKSECDSETGVINLATDKAIVGRQVIINNALEMVKWAKENLTSTHGFRRKFFHVPADKIDRNRPETVVNTVKGIRKIHQVRATPEYYKIMTRALSCYCENCRQDFPNWANCKNIEYAENFKMEVLVPVNERVSTPEKELSQGAATESLFNFPSDTCDYNELRELWEDEKQVGLLERYHC